MTMIYTQPRVTSSDLQLVEAVANPGANTNFTYTVGALPLILEAVHVTFTTDANVANRLFRFRVKRGANTLAFVSHTAVQAASLANTYSFTKGATTTTASSTSISVALPWLPVLLPGDIIESYILNLQATDAITNLVLWFTKVQPR